MRCRPARTPFKLVIYSKKKAREREKHIEIEGDANRKCACACYTLELDVVVGVRQSSPDVFTNVRANRPVTIKQHAT
jgi:hypothetical protein